MPDSPSGPSSPLLEVEGLRVSFPAPAGRVEVVRGVSFSLGRERLGIVGGSGSGRSMTGGAILRPIRVPGRVAATRLRFDGTDLDALPERRMRRLRGARISTIVQDPKFSLHPLVPVGRQIAESLRTHGSPSRRETRFRALEMLEAVRIEDPERVSRLHPHESSGGMGRRVMIATMPIARPGLLIADEPTSALDVSVQAGTLNLFKRLLETVPVGTLRSGAFSHDCSRALHAASVPGAPEAGR